MESTNARDCKYCFTVRGADSMIDLVHPVTGKTVIYGRTLEECRQEKGYEAAELMTVDDFCRDKADRQDEPVIWEETTEERFFEMLECLPPAYQTGGERGGAFLVGEPWDHHAATGRPRFAAYREIGDKFLVASRPMTVQEFKKALGV